MNRNRTLWLLAEGVTAVTVAGSQSPITIEPLGATHDPNRRVRVTRPWEPQYEDEPMAPDEVWEGNVADWYAAVREAATRPSFPGPCWKPGPCEAASNEAG